MNDPQIPPAAPAPEKGFDYPARRVQAQSDWHSAKATWNKRRYYALEIATLGAGALVPIVNVWAADSPYWARVWTTVFGGVVVVAASISKLFKFQENWLQYRATAEALAREIELFQARVADYAVPAGAKCNALLVERSEALLANVATRFVATHRAQARPDASGGANSGK